MEGRDGREGGLEGWREMGGGDEERGKGMEERREGIEGAGEREWGREWEGERG